MSSIVVFGFVDRFCGRSSDLNEFAAYDNVRGFWIVDVFIAKLMVEVNEISVYS